VTNGVEVDAETLTRLVRTLRCANAENKGFRFVEVVNEEVEVHLLRSWTLGPRWCHVGLNALKAKRHATLVDEVNAGHFGRVDAGPRLYFITSEGGIEGCEGEGIRTIKRN
jgi:hypothetical protein